MSRFDEDESIMDRRMNQNINIQKLSAKNFGLNILEFNSLCVSLSKGDNTLFERIYLSHFKVCQNYLIKNYKLSHNASYDVTMDTLISFRKGLILNKITYGNLNFLFTRMAYFLMIRNKKEIKKLDKEEYQYFENLGLIGTPEKEERLAKVDVAIKKLSSEKQQFLKDHYKANMKLIEIAKQNGLDNSVVRKRKQRILEELKKLIGLK